MDTVTAQTDTLEFEVRGVNIRLVGASVLPVGTAPESYALSRMPIPNGGVDRIGHRGLTVELAPDGVDEHDTFISPGVEVGSGVEIGARSKVKPAVVIGPNTKIGQGCRIGEHALVGSNVDIGDDNDIPPFAIVANGLEIPPGTFRFGITGPSTKDMMTEINQQLLDAMKATIGSLAR
jgi:hypothetical protein